jgi:uncharacterized protein (DUF2062 family)
MRINLAIVFSCILITNPITMGPAFYICYLLGAWILNIPGPAISFETQVQPDLATLLTQLSLIWRPLLVGCLAVGSLSGACGYILVNLAWRYHIIRKLRIRRARRDTP